LQENFDLLKFTYDSNTNESYDTSSIKFKTLGWV
jgi:hypothetical protein